VTKNDIPRLKALRDDPQTRYVYYMERLTEADPLAYIGRLEEQKEALIKWLDEWARTTEIEAYPSIVIDKIRKLESEP
jgi:hypothetical protein